jgi:phosphoribosylanthranilate isomerase
MFRIKICGVTNPADAMAAAEAGADAIGLNFYARSSRYIAPDQAARIGQELPDHVARVGVFVNAEPDFIRDTAQSARLDFVQLHGREPVEQLIGLADLRTIRAIRQGETSFRQIRECLDACQLATALPAAVLVDSASLGSFGGTGQTANWHNLESIRHYIGGCGLILAGGLNCQNVGAAIRQVHPDAVDVASGVESSPGCKSPELMQQFVREARKSWEYTQDGK